MARKGRGMCRSDPLRKGVPTYEGGKVGVSDYLCFNLLLMFFY